MNETTETTETTETLILKHLETVRAEMVHLRELERDILKRLTRLETLMARMGRDLAARGAEPAGAGQAERPKEGGRP